jgi:hypothetical protein
MSTRSISAEQLKRLQTLWSQYARKTGDVIGSQREERLSWASQAIERRIESFNDLSSHEAKTLIDVLQAPMGIPETEPAKGIRSRHRAHAAGTEGRKAKPGNEITLVSANELTLIDELKQKLGWDQARFDAWLRSPSSPGLSSYPQIRTLAEANRVIWAMKKMVRRAS